MLARLWQGMRERLAPPRRPPPELERLERRVQELQEVINRIAAELAAVLKDLAGQNFDIHVDRLAVDKVHLDKLIFKIDGIGVKDLSGSLSIGVNYGGKVIRLVSLRSRDNQTGTAPADNSGSPSVATPVEDGFSYRIYKLRGGADEK